MPKKNSTELSIALLQEDANVHTCSNLHKLWCLGFPDHIFPPFFHPKMDHPPIFCGFSHDSGDVNGPATPCASAASPPGSLELPKAAAASPRLLAAPGVVTHSYWDV